MSDIDRLSQLLRVALQEIADLRAGIPFHIHKCTADPEPHEWRCTSPYCFSTTARCLDHQGGPIGRPPQYHFDEQYVREPVHA